MASNSLSYDDSFENGTTTWIFYAGAAVASSSVDCTTSFTGTCSLRVNVASTSYQSVPQVIQLLRIDPNTNYTLKYRMKAAATTTAEVDVQANHDTYAFYGLDKSPTVTPSWQEYSYYFSSTATTTDTNSRLIFALGSSHTNTYWIDDVELIPDTLSSVRSPGFENINPSNDWTTYFQTGGTGNASVDCSSPTPEGLCSEKINVLQASPNNWYVQLQQPQSFATTTYLLTFDAKASIPRTADVYLNQNHAPGDQLTPTVSFNVSPSWSHYAIELSPTGDPLGRIIFSLDQATSTIWIDNVHFFKKQPTKVTAPPPSFTGIYSSSGSSTASAYEIQVIQRNGNWASTLWDSSKVTLSPQTQIGQRTATSTYAGPALPANGTDAEKYFWRMKVWDNNNNPSPWTNGTDYFMTPGNRVQDLSYTYDPVGNITRIVDASFTKSAKVANYTYDALNRLIQASTTPDTSSGAPNAGHRTLETWTYDALGNILTDTVNNGSITATTTYLYQGNSGSNYANPDAATTIGTTTLSYDNAGNLTQGLLGFRGAWDWRNRLMTATSSSETDSYSYDESDKRVRVGTPSVVYHYPNNLYEANSGTASVTKHVYLNGNDIAEIVGNTGSSTINYNFTDHLGSINVTADKNNRVQEVTDYAPYGKPNNHDQVNAYSSLRKYIGQVYDNPTGLSYLNARYYDGSRGQFTSQDPVFWNGRQNLLDPQSLNAYSYAEDNPITDEDPTGLITQEQSAQLDQVKKQLLQLQAALNGISGPIPQSILQSAQSTVNNAGSIVQQVSTGQGNSFGTMAQSTPAYTWQGNPAGMVGNTIFFAAAAASIIPEAAPIAGGSTQGAKAAVEMMPVIQRIGPFSASIGEDTTAAVYEALTQAAEYGERPMGLDNMPWSLVRSTVGKVVFGGATTAAIGEAYYYWFHGQPEKVDEIQ